MPLSRCQSGKQTPLQSGLNDHPPGSSWVADFKWQILSIPISARTYSWAYGCSVYSLFFLFPHIGFVFFFSFLFLSIFWGLTGEEEVRPFLISSNFLFDASPHF